MDLSQIKIAILLNILFGYVLSQTNPICKGRRYICSQIINIDSTICAHILDVKNKKYELWNCPNGYSCDFTNIVTNRYAYCVKDVDAEGFLPGEVCSTSTDCYSKSCIKSVCVGVAAAGSCSSNKECEVGLYCYFDPTSTSTVGVCKSQITFGKACVSDEDCTNNCVCSNSLCAYYYSLDVGIKADNAKACASGYVSSGKCANGLSSKDPSRPKPCSSDSECILLDSSGKQAATTECQCGYNPGSFSYCKLSEGDQEYKKVLQAFLFVLNTNYHCHTSLRYGPCKYIYDDEYMEYHQVLKLYEMAPQVTYNDYCIKRTFNWDYWQWVESNRLQYSLILLIFFIFYLY